VFFNFLNRKHLSLFKAYVFFLLESESPGQIFNGIAPNRKKPGKKKLSNKQTSNSRHPNAMVLELWTV
jgi:hypothetical protein